MSVNDPTPQKSTADCGILVVGGTSGVGLAVARHFAAAGARRIAIVGRDVTRGDAALALLKTFSPATHFAFIAGDANSVDQAESACKSADGAVNGVDVLVNTTAASYVPKLLFRTDVHEIAPMLLQQALAPMVMSRLVLPGMRERRFGVIINVASDAAKVPTPGETVIGAAMAAIVTFTRTLAMEAKRDGIRANVVTPSLIANTAVYERVMNDPFSAKLFNNAARLAHLGVAEPDDLAALIVFLASPGAARLTGQAISVNGGISAA